MTLPDCMMPDGAQPCVAYTELEARIAPFEGLLLGLFFISVGMSANLGLLLAQPLTLAALVVAFRRWKREAGDVAAPTDADRALVEAALAADREDEGR